MEEQEVWTRVFDIVRRELAMPTVWLAMQAARPLTIDGSYFVAGMARQDEYLASNLQDDQASTTIEAALRTVTGRVLAFRLIQGESLADWQAQKAEEAARQLPSAPTPPSTAVPPSTVVPPRAGAASSPAPPQPSPSSPPAPAGSAARPAPAPASEREVSPTWEKLNERLLHGYKGAPLIKFPHGQAQYVLTAVKIISDTMDVLMPPAGEARDDQGERMLAKTIERLGSVVNLDPMFLSLELLRYRESQGRNRDIPL